MTRKQAREQAFIIGFESLFTEESIDEIAETFHLAMDRQVDPFALQLCAGVAAQSGELDALIEQHLTGWKIGRISKVSLALLRIAAYEILHLEEIPASVSINEAVELAKKYGGDEDAPFINGVLGALLRGQVPAGE